MARGRDRKAPAYNRAMDPASPARRPVGPAAYWAGVAALVGFGALALFSYGLPFLTVGLALAALYPVRGRPRVFWPAVAAVVGLIAGYLLAAPLGCTTAPVPPGSGSARTTCGNLLGIDYSGPGSYRPPLLPAVGAGVAGAVAAGAAAGAVRWAQGRLRSGSARRPRPGP